MADLHGKDARRARHLLALANDQAGQPEGEAARRQVDKILARHGWTEEDLAETVTETRMLVELRGEATFDTLWLVPLLQILAEAMKLTTEESSVEVGVRGPVDELDRFCEVFGWAEDQIAKAAGEFSLEMAEIDHPSLMLVYYRGYAVCAVLGLLDRLRDPTPSSPPPPAKPSPATKVRSVIEQMTDIRSLVAMVLGRSPDEKLPSEDEPTVVPPVDDPLPEDPAFAGPTLIDQMVLELGQFLDRLTPQQVTACREGYDFGFQEMHLTPRHPVSPSRAHQET